jgi:hypothetical protein
MSSKEDFNKALSLLGDEVNKNIVTITPKDLKVPLLFRIDAELPKTFIPRMPKSAAHTENSTVPRVVTATTLLGCLTGHAHVFWLVKDRNPLEELVSHYVISAFEFDHAILPNEKLVYDAKESKEAWLIAYDKNTTEYKAKRYGEMFVIRLSVEARPNAEINKEIAELALEVSGPLGLPLGDDTVLPKGFYHLRMDTTTYALGSNKKLPKRMSTADEDKVTVTPISASTYNGFRALHVKK